MSGDVCNMAQANWNACRNIKYRLKDMENKMNEYDLLVSEDKHILLPVENLKPLRVKLYNITFKADIIEDAEGNIFIKADNEPT